MRFICSNAYECKHHCTYDAKKTHEHPGTFKYLDAHWYCIYMKKQVCCLPYKNIENIKLPEELFKI